MDLACSVQADQSRRVGVAFRTDGTAKRGGEGRVTPFDRLERAGRAKRMTAARYVLAVALILVALGPIAAAAQVWRRRILPLPSGPPAMLASIVLAMSSVVCVVELLGTVHTLLPLHRGDSPRCGWLGCLVVGPEAAAVGSWRDR